MIGSAVKRIVRAVVSRSVSPPAPAPDLFDAIARDDMQALRARLSAGASPDAKRGDGVTPLTFAGSYHSAPAVRILLEYGANPDLPSSDNMLLEDYAQNNSEINALLHEARAARTGEAPNENSPIRSWVSSDLQDFLRDCDLLLPESGMDFLRSRLRSSHGEEGAREVENELANTNYRVLLEQVFGPESLGCSYLSADNRLIRSPMALGRYEVGFAKRRGFDLVDRLKNLYEVTDALLYKLLPDEYFTLPPKRICEIGGAWGATIKHLSERFHPEEYENYEPDRHYAEWTAERFGAKKMPVDGETLRGTATDSVDLMIANNVLIFVPPIKVWSYLREMRRVTRKDGIILFNAVLSDELNEGDLDHYLATNFPRRQIQIIPGDIIDRTLPESQFLRLPVPAENKYNKEYRVYKRIL